MGQNKIFLLIYFTTSDHASISKNENFILPTFFSPQAAHSDVGIKSFYENESMLGGRIVAHMGPHTWNPVSPYHHPMTSLRCLLDNILTIRPSYLTRPRTYIEPRSGSIFQVGYFHLVPTQQFAPSIRSIPASCQPAYLPLYLDLYSVSSQGPPPHGPLPRIFR